MECVHLWSAIGKSYIRGGARRDERGGIRVHLEVGTMEDINVVSNDKPEKVAQVVASRVIKDVDGIKDKAWL